MTTQMRQSTLETLGLGTVLEIFQRGRLPVSASDLIDEVFGQFGDRGALVISGANGIVGSGKAMQLGARLQPFLIPIIALDLPNAPDGLGKQYPGLIKALGKPQADKVMGDIIRLTYDGTHLPPTLDGWKVSWLLEALPEKLELKRAHYELFRAAYPGVEIRSVTSGFPSSELGVGILHPAFPHQSNKVWEVVEQKPSPITKLLWALGLIPVPVSDHWSFVLDVLFCGLTLAGLRYHQRTNMPYWKIDKYIRSFVGPNPFRAHDVIGAKGSAYLTWSCLHHLEERYGTLFQPSRDLVERKETGQAWYPLNHSRPMVDWEQNVEKRAEFASWIYGPLFQMASLLLQEKRGHLSHLNAMGELCAQFRNGILTMIRALGLDAAIQQVRAFHELCPEAAKSCWYPDAFKILETPAGQQLYVNAEHDGTVGVITISRESYNGQVDKELNRAIDWLKDQGIGRVIVTGDFHLSTQMVGADTSEFFPALDDEKVGFQISETWSRTARRLHEEFQISVGFINGKRCLGGMLELLLHCHYVVAVNSAQLGMPEITLPVIPGMEGCHWPFRKTGPENWPKLVQLLLTGKPIKATEGVNWLIDYAGPMEEALQMTWQTAMCKSSLRQRKTSKGPLIVPITFDQLPFGQANERAIIAMTAAIQSSCGALLRNALQAQATFSSEFMTTDACKGGKVGQEAKKIMDV